VAETKDNLSLSVEQLQFTAGFHDWANARVLDAAAAAGPAFLVAVIPGSYGQGGAFEVLAHVVGAEIHWLNRWLGNPRSVVPDATAWPTVTHLREAWEGDLPRRRAFFQGLTEEALRADYSYYRNNPPVLDSRPLWPTVLHVFNHSAHHRGEVCAALTALGHAPESVDMIEYIRTR